MKINIQKQFKKNLKYFKEHLPHIYKAIVSYNLSRKIEVAKRNDAITVSLDGKTLTINKIENIVNKQLENFEQNTVCFTTRETYNPKAGFGIQKYYTNKLFQISHDLLKKETTSKPTNYIPVMIIYGVISGIHIQKLIEKYDIDHLIIVEKDVSLLKPSLYIIDWKKILNTFLKENKSINILISDNPIYLANKAMLTIINDISPSFVTRLFLFIHFENTLLDAKDFIPKFLEEFRQEFLLSTSSLGFFDDEMLSLKHTYVNVVKNKIPIFRSQKLDNKIKEIPVFICGSGPSLDLLIDTIKKLSEKAFIISCGTALKSLISYGIKPDIHFEMERTKVTYDILVSSVGKNTLKSLNLIGLNLLYPEVFSLFSRKGAIIKTPDSCTTIFPDNYQRFDYVNPTVTNTAISFFSHLNFKNIYLFGTDYGFWDEEQHHSKNTIYFEKKSHKMKGDIEIDGNFGNKIYTTSTFFYSKKITEMIIAKFPHINYYNPNYGAKIKGTKTIKSDEIVVANITIDKNQAIANLFGQFHELEENEKNIFTERMKSSLEQAINFSRSIIDKISEKKKTINTIKDLYSLFHELHKNLRILERTNYSSYTLVKGSLYHIMRIILFFAWQIDEKNIQLYLNKALDILEEFIKSMQTTMKQEINKLECKT